LTLEAEAREKMWRQRRVEAENAASAADIAATRAEATAKANEAEAIRAEGEARATETT